MAKRAVLLDRDNEVIAHLTYAEMDGYIERGLVERITAIKASTHKFRLLDLEAQQQRVQPEIFDRLEFDQTSLTASVSRANAGVADCISDVLWARRRVHIWPYVGDTLATRVACRRPERRRKPTRPHRRG